MGHHHHHHDYDIPTTENLYFQGSESPAAPPTTAPPPHVIIVPSAGMGHLIPLAEFAKRLLPRFTFTFAVPTSGPPSSSQRDFLSSLPASIDTSFLPEVDLSDAPSDAQIETLMSLMVVRSLPSLRDLIASYSASGRRVAALVVDLFATDAIDVALELGIRPFIFFPSTAMTLSFFLHLEKLDETVSCEFAELSDPVQIPGCIPVHGKDLIDPVQDRKNDAYKWLLHHSKRYKLAEGVIVNSFEGLEGGPIRELLHPEPGKPRVYPVGPLIQAGSCEKGAAARPECLKWLDQQPRGSVLFVNFGSGGVLSTEQQNELAGVLAHSQQRFLWVVRPPNDGIANATYFSVDGEIDPLKLLPEGFLEQTAGRGLVLPMWAPQIDVLSHESTGGFLTHCGWNSTLESVFHGVPLITWPLYAEQKMNAVMLTEGLRVGLRPSVGKDGIIRGAEIARVIGELMEGEEGKRIRSKMQELKRAASAVLSKDGSSTRALEEVAKIWESKV
uniref:Glycosyltransferase n=1 Tax=Persicaria tinctoria TaxID=96455 RepID=UPI000CA159BA|nr:Chain A, Glycosyltransferase [Persicaria tinctoria]6SU6_B Chain B, Glycosyltransferase [Persicaria tinctoria]6SU7_A Chain A, Glycosyltransferase [Persicaria tinctoria]6SU7_B Chain B, Glycosyltransferase [Persicaria tinctoria]6SU7_C Chain C, Glycosyltransferase [Persicaria tinctoria]6SU7_D Chain D, Glycosyltransferase [Persicaria tinctoria]AUO17147.1 PtUGT72B29 indoxyl glucosyltransferase [Expression vector pTMH307]